MSTLFQFRCLTLLLAAVLGVARLASAQSDSPLLPGELPLEADRELISADPLPTIRQVMQGVDDPQLKVLAGLRYFSGEKNHYAPAWSPDGKSLLCLRSDLGLQTCKLMLFSRLDSPKPIEVYSEFFTYEHMPAWLNARRPGIVLASNNEDAREENLHLLRFDRDTGGYTSVRLTTGAGIKVLPSLHVGANGGELLYRREADLIFSRNSLTTGVGETSKSWGGGQEARWSPHGRFAALIRADEAFHTLQARDPKTNREITLFAEPERLIRNAVWSPDEKTVAFLSRKEQDLAWELWIVPLSARPTPKRLVAGVRADEDFSHVGPVWTPDSRKIWYFPATGDQGHYPLAAVSVDGKTETLDYPAGITTAMDVALFPNADRPAVAFAAVKQRAVDIFVLLLNHY